jgi:hypothetical protein
MPSSPSRARRAARRDEIVDACAACRPHRARAARLAGAVRHRAGRNGLPATWFACARICAPPSHGARLDALRPAWTAGWPADRRMRAIAACSTAPARLVRSDHRPRSCGVMRPMADTAVASMTSRPAPGKRQLAEVDHVPVGGRSIRRPSTGTSARITTRFLAVSGPREYGVNSWLMRRAALLLESAGRRRGCGPGSGQLPVGRPWRRPGRSGSRNRP